MEIIANVATLDIFIPTDHEFRALKRIHCSFNWLYKCTFQF